jgi:hypothetical protein
VPVLDQGVPNVGEFCRLALDPLIVDRDDIRQRTALSSSTMAASFLSSDLPKQSPKEPDAGPPALIQLCKTNSTPPK